MLRACSLAGFSLNGGAMEDKDNLLKRDAQDILPPEEMLIIELDDRIEFGIPIYGLDIACNKSKCTQNGTSCM
jgi:hypothetical protein